MTDLVERLNEAAKRSADYALLWEAAEAIAAAEARDCATITRERDEAVAREAVMREAACKCWPTSSHHEPGCPVLEDDFSPRAEALLRVVEAARKYCDESMDNENVNDSFDDLYDACAALRAYQEGSSG